MGGPERAATPPPLYGDGVHAVGAAADEDGDDALMVMITLMTIFSSSWYDPPPRRLHPRHHLLWEVQRLVWAGRSWGLRVFFSKVHFFRIAVFINSITNTTINNIINDTNTNLRVLMIRGVSEATHMPVQKPNPDVRTRKLQYCEHLAIIMR